MTIMEHEILRFWNQIWNGNIVFGPHKHDNQAINILECIA